MARFMKRCDAPPHLNAEDKAGLMVYVHSRGFSNPFFKKHNDDTEILILRLPPGLFAGVTTGFVR
jgi:hypothetical protein